MKCSDLTKVIFTHPCHMVAGMKIEHQFPKHLNCKELNKMPRFLEKFMFNNPLSTWGGTEGLEGKLKNEIYNMLHKMLISEKNYFCLSLCHGMEVSIGVSCNCFFFLKLIEMSRSSQRSIL